MDLDTLDFTSLVAATEATLFEPVLHGSATGVDDVLDKWQESLDEMFVREGLADDEALTRAAQEGLQRAQQVFPQAEPRPAPPDASTIPP